MKERTTYSGNTSSLSVQLLSDFVVILRVETDGRLTTHR